LLHVECSRAIAALPPAPGQPAATGEASSEVLALDDKEISILKVLLRHRGKYLVNVEIEANGGPSRRTLTEQLPRLIDLKLAAKARHKKRGVTITDAGVAAVTPFLPKKPAQ
jgi:hypothetical protein